MHTVCWAGLFTWKYERDREMFYLTTHSIHFIYGYMVSDTWLRTILIVRKETRCCHIGYSYRLTARVSFICTIHRQDNIYHGLCYTSRGALAGTRNSSMGPPHEGSIQRLTAPWAMKIWSLSFKAGIKVLFVKNNIQKNYQFWSVIFIVYKTKVGDLLYIYSPTDRIIHTMA